MTAPQPQPRPRPRRTPDWHWQLLAAAALLWVLLGVWQAGLVCAVLALTYVVAASRRPS